MVKKYPTFRERSEIPEVSTEISLQPWRNYGVDGCILFSDILTPLPGMGVEFDIEEKAGPKLKPMRTLESLEHMYVNSDWSKATPFVKETLGDLRKTVGARAPSPSPRVARLTRGGGQVGNTATVLGFVGLPYTLATYLVEGGTSKEYLEIKKMMYTQPQILHKMLEVQRRLLRPPRPRARPPFPSLVPAPQLPPAPGLRRVADADADTGRPRRHSRRTSATTPTSRSTPAPR